MIDLNELKNELIAGHPVSGAYSADYAVAETQINALNRSGSRVTLSASEIFEALDIVEYEALSATVKGRVQLILTLGDNVQVGPSTRTRAILLAAFGAGTNTRTNLIAAVTYSISRAQELFGDYVQAGHIEKARAL